jgi:hypothetical protein
MLPTKQEWCLSGASFPEIRFFCAPKALHYIAQSFWFTNSRKKYANWLIEGFLRPNLLISGAAFCVR